MSSTEHDPRWPHIAELLARSDGQIMLGHVAPIEGAAVATAEQALLAALVRRKGESVNALLQRLDEAIGRSHWRCAPPRGPHQRNQRREPPPGTCPDAQEAIAITVANTTRLRTHHHRSRSASKLKTPCWPSSRRSDYAQRCFCIPRSGARTAEVTPHGSELGIAPPMQISA
jgi:hypothetical protein